MPLWEAREAIEAERRNVRAELRAFREFGDRAAEVSIAQSGDAGTNGAIRVLNATGRRASDRLQAAYRETVMNVGHYQADYGEDLVENAEIELGTEVAALLQPRVTVTPEDKQRLLQATGEAQRRRADYLQILEEEAALLRETQEFVEQTRPLPDVSGDESLRRHHEVYQQLREIENEIEERIADRQEHLQKDWAGVSRTNRIDPKSLNEFLYRSLATTYPALDSLTVLLGDLRQRKTAVSKSVASYRG